MMKKIEIPEHFDPNVFKILVEGLDSGIPDDQNIIGSSQIGFCAKKIVISKLQNNRFNSNAKMLMGQIFENELYRPSVLSLLILAVDQMLGLNSDGHVINPQAQKLIELVPGYFFRITPDVYTNYYMIEVKTTSAYAKEWKRELVNYQVLQLNTQLGAFGIDLGFILKVNIRAFLSNIKEDENYWDKLWNDYGYFLPWYFHQETYDNTLKRATWLLECIRDKIIPEEENAFSWECGYCPESIRKECGKEEYTCFAPKCYKKIYEHPEILTKEFKDFPMCEKCFTKENPHSKYIKYKFINYKQMETDTNEKT